MQSTAVLLGTSLPSIFSNVASPDGVSAFAPPPADSARAVVVGTLAQRRGRRGRRGRRVHPAREVDTADGLAAAKGVAAVRRAVAAAALPLACGLVFEKIEVGHSALPRMRVSRLVERLAVRAVLLKPVAVAVHRRLAGRRDVAAHRLVKLTV